MYACYTKRECLRYTRLYTVYYYLYLCSPIIACTVCAPQTLYVKDSVTHVCGCVLCSKEVKFFKHAQSVTLSAPYHICVSQRTLRPKILRI